MSTTTTTTTRTKLSYKPISGKTLTLKSYHSNVMAAMCTQMTSDRPIPLAKKPASSSSHHLSQHVQEEMDRRAKADRVLQDLSSEKSRSQARERETARRNKWAKSIAGACPASDVPVVKRQIAAAYPRAVRNLETARRGEVGVVA